MMIQTLQNLLQNVCLAALAVFLAALAGIASRRMAMCFTRHLTGLWRSLTVFGRVVAASFAFVCVLYGGSKTNFPQRIIQPLRTMARQFAPVQSADADFFVDNWNKRGAWRDSLKFDFDGEWRFPWGDGHLSSVEVMAWGEIRPVYNNTNAIARTGIPLAIVPGLTEFSCGPTQSNSYRFAWTSAAANRDTNDLVTASIELMRCGDVTVTTNGVSWTMPRVLPFSHDGFGQNAEWVVANFTNATEITETGYAEWVDAQIGHGLTNGFFKYTATFPDAPPETVQLVVGDYSIAVTNAGAYVFLLEKGVEYEYGTSPFLTNVMYSAADDIPLPGLRLRSIAPGDPVRMWTADGGYYNTPQTEDGLGRVWWMPTLCGSPDVSHIGPDANPMTFMAVLTDCRNTNDVSFTWSAGGGIAVVSPNAQMTEVRIDEMPSWAEAALSVSATLGNHTLTSQLDGLTYGTNDTPQVHIALDIPDALLLNSNEVDAAKIAAAGWSFDSDIPTTGVLRVSCTAGEGKVNASGLTGEWQVQGGESLSNATIEGIKTSDMVGDVLFRAEFVSYGETNAITRALTVVRTDSVAIPSAPEDGLIVLTNTPVAMHLACAPNGAGALLSTMWHVRRLKSDGTHEDWQLAAYEQQGASFVFTPTHGGIYQVRSLASVSAGGTDERFYVWETDEPSTTGLKKRGNRKSFGVCDEQWQIDLRNCAKSHLGSSAYAFGEELSGEYGFSSIPGDTWKCNYFVAYRIREAGLPLSVQRQRLWHNYPPLANDWANGAGIANWEFLGSALYVQPGYVVGHPASLGSGHVGIVDFDGGAIAAGGEIVNRRFKKWLDGTSGFNRLINSQ